MTNQMQSELLIGLYSNGSRAGKDSIARTLVVDYGFQQRNMANAIRQILLDLNPLIIDSGGSTWFLQDLYKYCGGNWDEIKAEAPQSVDYMISLGQSCRDNLAEDIWLNTVIRNRPLRLVIADVRQPNEYHAIKARGGQVWKVTRPSSEKRGMDGLLEGYDFDVELINDGTLDELEFKVHTVMGLL